MPNEINTLSNASIARLQRVADKSDSTPQNVNFYRKKNKRGKGGGVVAKVETYPFQTTMKYNSTEETYNVTVLGGQVVLPDGQSLLDPYLFDNILDDYVYIYLKVSGTPTGNGGYIDFIAAIEEFAEEQINTDDTSYYLISFIEVNVDPETEAVLRSIYQQRFVSFDSGGLVY